MTLPTAGWASCGKSNNGRATIWKSGDWAIFAQWINNSGVNGIAIANVSSTTAIPTGVVVSFGESSTTVASDWPRNEGFTDCGMQGGWGGPFKSLTPAVSLATWNAGPTVTSPTPDPAPECDIRLTVQNNQICFETVPYTPTVAHMTRAMAGKHVLVRGVTLQLGKSLRQEVLDDGKFLVCFENRDPQALTCADFDLVDKPAGVLYTFAAGNISGPGGGGNWTWRAAQQFPLTGGDTTLQLYYAPSTASYLADSLVAVSIVGVPPVEAIIGGVSYTGFEPVTDDEVRWIIASPPAAVHSRPSTAQIRVDDQRSVNISLRGLGGCG